MTRRVIGLVMLALIFVGYHTGAVANCGPWFSPNMFGDSDYCVVCSDGQKKVNQCPGGDLGMAITGTQYPGCQITYWNPHSCFAISTTSSAPSSISTVARNERDQNSAKTQVKPGRGVVTKRGDVVTIRMHQSDFEKFMSQRPQQ